MFNKILIANRGEIACRVIRTCKRLGIHTVAVYSDADHAAQHVKQADQAIHIGGSRPSESYLRGDVILAAAKSSGAQAIHPGYGFLSENAAFARACKAAGIAFIGPSADAIDKMGSKSAAKRIMQAAKVPVVPGYHGDDQDPALLAREAEKISYPVLIKAVAGGGGKGMRVVESAAQFAANLEAAKREAKNAFGDDAVLIEKFVSGPHHIEFQVFGDGHGNAVHLFERECSIQRRHQKVLEETPSPFLDDALRTRMGDAAVAAVHAIGYANAGTIEFIVGADRQFYFMEMNTRLQVEHPITEMITGLDLVEWQLRVAAGEKLPLTQQQITRRGHAIEVRLCAEQPAKDFLPDTGKLALALFPTADAHTRVDTGVATGDEISVYYDSMIAKLISYGEDRTNAIQAMRSGLAHCAIIGPHTNLAFLQRLLQHDALVAGHTDTHFIAAHREALLAEQAPSPPVWAAAALRVMHEQDRASVARAHATSEAHSPWWNTDGWRMNAAPQRQLRLKLGDQVLAVQAQPNNASWQLEHAGNKLNVQEYAIEDHVIHIETPDTSHRILAAQAGERICVATPDARWELRELRFEDELPHEESSGRLTALMPGRVIKVLAVSGESVKQGQPLLIMEAMKMEHTIASPRDGVIETVFFRENDLVPAEAVLFAFREG